MNKEMILKRVGSLDVFSTVSKIVFFFFFLLTGVPGLLTRSGFLAVLAGGF